MCYSYVDLLLHECPQIMYLYNEDFVTVMNLVLVFEWLILFI